MTQYINLAGIALAGLLALMHTAAYAYDGHATFCHHGQNAKPILVDLQTGNGDSLAQKYVYKDTCAIVPISLFNHYGVVIHNSNQDIIYKSAFYPRREQLKFICLDNLCGEGKDGKTLI